MNCKSKRADILFPLVSGRSLRHLLGSYQREREIDFFGALRSHREIPDADVYTPGHNSSYDTIPRSAVGFFILGPDIIRCITVEIGLKCNLQNGNTYVKFRLLVVVSHIFPKYPPTSTSSSITVTVMTDGTWKFYLNILGKEKQGFWAVPGTINGRSVMFDQSKVNKRFDLPTLLFFKTKV